MFFCNVWIYFHSLYGCIDWGNTQVHKKDKHLFTSLLVELEIIIELKKGALFCDKAANIGIEVNVICQFIEDFVLHLPLFFPIELQCLNENIEWVMGWQIHWQNVAIEALLARLGCAKIVF